MLVEPQLFIRENITWDKGNINKLTNGNTKTKVAQIIAKIKLN